MIIGIIPARYASARFPGKALIDLDGTTMIQRVYEQAQKAKSLDKVVVATDDVRIANHVRSFKGNVVMTSPDHQSGTDRCWDAYQEIAGSYEYVLNIQGDEPFLNPAQIEELCAVLTSQNVEIATQMIRVGNSEDLFDEGEVKIVLNDRQEGMYFSRMPIPYLKGIPQDSWHLHHDYYRHVGLYAYRKDVLGKISQLPVSSLEKAESLEQLRWLQAGFTIKCVPTKFESHCIDTIEDVAKVLGLMKH